MPGTQYFPFPRSGSSSPGDLSKGGGRHREGRLFQGLVSQPQEPPPTPVSLWFPRILLPGRAVRLSVAARSPSHRANAVLSPAGGRAAPEHMVLPWAKLPGLQERSWVAEAWGLGGVGAGRGQREATGWPAQRSLCFLSKREDACIDTRPQAGNQPLRKLREKGILKSRTNSNEEDR